MLVTLLDWHPGSASWSPAMPARRAGSGARLILAASSEDLEPSLAALQQLAHGDEQALLMACSGAGHAAGDSMARESGLAAAVLDFEHTRLVAAHTADQGDALAEGRQLGVRLLAAGSPDAPLTLVLLFGSPGLDGSLLLQGLREALPAGTAVVGGLAGRLQLSQTPWVVTENGALPGGAAAVGLYGNTLRWHHDCSGGWSPFGPVRTVTRAEGDMLLELDGEPALALYRRYLGRLAEGLPEAAWHFPLGFHPPSLAGGTEPSSPLLVRTVLAIDEARGGLRLVSRVPDGAPAQLMRARSDSLLEGAERSLQERPADWPAGPKSLLLWVGCVGRKVALGLRADEELAVLQRALPDGVPHLGFYSYGEIGRAAQAGAVALHNQTLSVLMLREEPPAATP